MTDLGIGGAVAFVNVVSKSMALRALGEGFGRDGDLGGNTFVVHECLFLEEFVYS